MDAKTIHERGKALNKATQANEAPSIIIGILNELKKGVVATEETLRSTKIGVIVSKAKLHKNQEVSSLAGGMVKKWREDLERQRSAASKKAPSSGTSSPATGSQKTKIAAPTVAPDKRNWKTDKVDVNRTGQDTRDRCIGLLYDGLVFLSSQTSSTILGVALAVENAAYLKFNSEEKEPYTAKIRSLYLNLKSKSNPELRVRVVGGSISPDKFVNMTSDELKSESLKKEEDNLKSENMRMAEVPKGKTAVSSSLTCSKCGQKKVSYTQAQTRSADEPMTTFCECTVCGKRWKFS